MYLEFYTAASPAVNELRKGWDEGAVRLRAIASVLRIFRENSTRYALIRKELIVIYYAV